MPDSLTLSPLFSQSIWMLLGSVVAAAVCALALTRGSGSSSSSYKNRKRQAEDNHTTMSIAFLGNSILYFNDCPRLVEQMLQSCYDTVVQDSCLRGGATLPSLFRQGNGMQRTFATPAARQSDGTYDIGASSVEDLLSKSHWDVVVLHDHTQAPARRESREETLTSLEQEYLPLLRKQQQQHKPITYVQRPIMNISAQPSISMLKQQMKQQQTQKPKKMEDFLFERGMMDRQQHADMQRNKMVPKVFCRLF
jgi:hypothetical protein